MPTAAPSPVMIFVPACVSIGPMVLLSSSKRSLTNAVTSGRIDSKRWGTGRRESGSPLRKSGSLLASAAASFETREPSGIIVTTMTATTAT